MCEGMKYFSAIPCSIYVPPRELQWYWTYLDLSVVPAQPVPNFSLPGPRVYPFTIPGTILTTILSLDNFAFINFQIK